jgi:hypothetical protein
MFMSLYFTTGGSGAPAGSANLIYATPDGSAGSASLRALAAGDFPVLNSSSIGGKFLPSLKDRMMAVSTSVGVAINNVVRAVEVFIESPLTVGHVVAKMSATGTAGTKFYIGVYSRDGLTKLLEGKFANDSIAAQSVAITAGGTVTLKPGYYLVAFGCDASTGSCTSALSLGNNNIDDAFLNKNGTRQLTAGNAISSGALPTTLGTLTVLSGLNVPSAYFEV